MKNETTKMERRFGVMKLIRYCEKVLSIAYHEKMASAVRYL
jgi:hypothetical protein